MYKYFGRYTLQFMVIGQCLRQKRRYIKGVSQHALRVNPPPPNSACGLAVLRPLPPNSPATTPINVATP